MGSIQCTQNVKCSANCGSYMLCMVDNMHVNKLYQSSQIVAIMILKLHITFTASDKSTAPFWV